MSTTTQTLAEARTNRVEYAIPRVDLHHDNDNYVLEVEMPGVSKDGIEITVDDGKLTILGNRASAERAGRAVYSERPRAEYRRVFDLDPSIDAAKISASIEQGLLTVKLHKAEAAKPRKITVG